MATAAVETCQPLDFGVVGIHRNPSTSDFKSSLDTYNALPDDSEQPDVGPGTLKALAEIFVRHGAHKVYGLHLVHGHSQAPQGTVMVGTTFVEEGKNMCWTKPTPVSELDEDVHGHIYQLRDGAFIPYEYRRGRLDAKFYEVNDAFFKELATYLAVHNLAGLLGLEVLDRPRT
ncbi:hypothetical protein PG985_014978 [Apiospora marii]|uniref:Uncharacterized protein n=1 Tax=Apiospora marii TaxID=335849 RepID=A0ABR1RIQ3_9PEZI